jgi:hypothetical protein
VLTVTAAPEARVRPMPPLVPPFPVSVRVPFVDETAPAIESPVYVPATVPFAMSEIFPLLLDVDVIPAVVKIAPLAVMLRLNELLQEIALETVIESPAVKVELLVI